MGERPFSSEVDFINGFFFLGKAFLSAHSHICLELLGLSTIAMLQYNRFLTRMHDNITFVYEMLALRE